MPTLSPASTPSAARAPELTQPCVRCGAPVPLDVGLCEDCNPLGLKDSASSQAHGTVFVAIVAGVVLLAIGGRFAISGVGPFPASIAGYVESPPGISVTLRVRNEGTSAGSTSCHVTAPTVTSYSAAIQTPTIGAGEEVTFSRLVTGFGSGEKPFLVECRTP